MVDPQTERTARAICRVEAQRYANRLEQEPWINLNWTQFVPHARAALEAMHAKGLKQVKNTLDHWAFKTEPKATVWVLCYILRFPEKPFEFWPQAHNKAFTSEQEARDFLAWIDAPNSYAIVKVDLMERKP